jgi:hypothetical protein
VLGQAGPENFVRDFTGAPRANTYYPDALANSLAGRDLDTAHPEIEANFNSAFGYWYLGTDGRPDVNSYDFESVVLHELGHGFGLVGTFDGLTPPGWTDTGRGYVGLAGSGDYPTIFDRLVVDGLGRDGLNSGVYPSGSTPLGGLLRGANGGLQWKGAGGVIAATGPRPRLYSPASFEEGSSVSHLDEAAYPAGSPNALMTPYLQNGESAHDPGPIVRGMFEDMGWRPAASCAAAGGTTTDRFVPQLPTVRGTYAMTAGVPFNVPMLGSAGVPTGGVSAVLASLNVAGPSASGVLAAGSGCAGAMTAAQQYTAGRNRSGLVSIPLDSLGRMQLQLTAGAANVTVSVHGWYAPSASATGLFTAIPKARASGVVVKAGTPVDIPTNGVGGLPATGVDAVLLNVTVSNPSLAGTLSLGPGGTNPVGVQQTFAAGRAISQLVVAKRSADGKVRVVLSAGTSTVLVDVWGFYGAPVAGGGNVPHRVLPRRVLSAATAPDVTFTVPGLPTNTRSVALLVTASAPAGAGYVGAAAGRTTATSLPGCLQYYAGDAIGNLVVVPVGPGNTVRLKTNGGGTKLYADVLGYNATT